MDSSTSFASDDFCRWFVNGNNTVESDQANRGEAGGLVNFQPREDEEVDAEEEVTVKRKEEQK